MSTDSPWCREVLPWSLGAATLLSLGPDSCSELKRCSGARPQSRSPGSSTGRGGVSELKASRAQHSWSPRSELCGSITKQQQWQLRFRSWSRALRAPSEGGAALTPAGELGSATGLLAPQPRFSATATLRSSSAAPRQGPGDQPLTLSTRKPCN